MRRERKRLGALLVEEHIISQEQLDNALDRQRENGGILGNILVDMGYVEANVLMPMLARHYARLQPTVADCRISPDIVRLLSGSLAREFCAMPINATRNEVTLAISNPMNDRAVQALASHLRRKVRPVLCPPDTIMKAISLHYGPDELIDTGAVLTTEFRQPLPKFTFENIVVGDANRAAYTAAEAAGDFPGTSHNPLLIYGDVGHGKTHLLCAIGNRASANDPIRRIAWIPASELEMELTEAIERNQVKEFRGKYQRADVLLLDDIQFLAQRRGVQQEFAKLFNLLCSQGRQIAVTSDRPLGELDVLIEEIRSQFSNGVAVRVGTTSEALKTAILMTKQKGASIRLPDQLIAELARSLPDDIRYLEGALRNLNLRLSISQEKPSLETIRRVLTEMGNIHTASR